MKKIIFIFFLLFSFNLLASDIAIINMEEVAKNSTAFKKFKENLEKERDIYQAKIKQKEIELNAKKDDLESKTSLLSQETLQKQAIDFQKEVLSFQEEVKNKEIELQNKLNYALDKLNNEINLIIKNITSEDNFKKYSMIINSNAVLYNKEKDNDITMTIIKKINEKNISLIQKKK